MDKARWLWRRFDFEEVKKAVFNYGKEKSLRSDEYSMAFFQDCW